MVPVKGLFSTQRGHESQAENHCLRVFMDPRLFNLNLRLFLYQKIKHILEEDKKMWLKTLCPESKLEATVWGHVFVLNYSDEQPKEHLPKSCYMPGPEYRL